MSAAVTVAHGGPEVLEVRDDHPTPAPQPHEVLVRVRAAGVNNTDIWSREGAYGSPVDPDAVAGWRGVPLEFPRIQGMDICGEVVALGAGSDPVWLGRRVLIDPTNSYDRGLPSEITGSESDGGFAEFHVSHEDQLHDVTDSALDDAQLACLPTAYGTALGMINRAGCAHGERVLVTGASGGVGFAAVQLLVARGCEVVARTSGAHRQLLADAGATEVSVRGTDELSASDEVAVAVDVVGGPEFGQLVECLEPGGRLVVAGAIAGPIVEVDLRRLYLPNRRLIGSTMHTPDDFAELADLARQGRVAPVVADTYRLADIAAAQRRFGEGDFVGKLVLVP